MKIFVTMLAGIMLSALVLGCSSPSVSRTAVVRDVTIGETLSPDSLQVHAGDEVRWVNGRKDDVQIDVPRLKDTDLACQRGFSNWLGLTRESTQVKPNETVSLCFEDPGVLHYTVRSDTTLAGGKQILNGSVQITDNR